MASKRILVKIGTNVITKDNGCLDLNIMANIVAQMAQLKKEKHEIIVISSGAMGAGRSLIKLPKNSNRIVRRQLLCAVGQIKLMETYFKLFKKHQLVCAQVLATKEDFRDRHHYLNMRNCFTALVHDQIIPIANENDVTSVDELMFTDNDELAGMIAAMMNIDSLILMTSVDGIYNKDPSDKNSQIIHQIAQGDGKSKNYLTPSKSLFGRGGMLTKYQIAEKMAKLGIKTHIINGRTKNSLLELLSGKKIGTTFIPAAKKSSNIKKWLANSSQQKAKVFINDCAVEKLLCKDQAISLLPVGIIKIGGNFEKGDIIQICDEKQNNIAIGTAQYSAKTAKTYLGQRNKKPLIHYNHLFLE